ncbi:hypothetical protein KR009_007540, partial [Drosophila setifemur]
KKEREKDKEKRSSMGKLKYNQKFCEKWLKIFEPWLQRDANDPNKPFCRACQCSMDCNRCHLVRHEHTTKHKRNLEALLTQGEVAACRELRVRQERSKYYRQWRQTKKTNIRDSLGNETAEESSSMVVLAENNSCSTEEATVPKQEHLPEMEATSKIVEPPPSSSPRRDGSTASNQEGLKLLLQIHQDKNELMESFRELMGSQTPTQNPPPAKEKEKNHVDLFFESVSSSVKALSPKLIAEAKMRVSQLICELELRGLKENSPSEDAVTNPLANNLFVLRQA